MHINNISTSFDRGKYRVSAVAEGAPLWFESCDIALRPSPEAFASAMLIPSIARGEAVTVESGLSPVWLANASRLLPIFREWWGYPELAPQSVGHSLVFPGQTKVCPTSSTALCFSGGIDSFYTLLRSGYAINYLIFVIGFDMKMDDIERAETFISSLREVAAETGAQPVVVRTNIRENPAFASVSWEHTHGGAMAAIGHLISDAAGQLLISSSRSFDDLLPWGSHWMTDEFWSSEWLRVIHFGAELMRRQKLALIAAEPIVRKHLRVCWENNAPSGNCSRCEKCVRTRLMLLACGELPNFPVFDGKETLASDIDALPPSDKRLLTHHQVYNQPGISPEIKHAIRRLIERNARVKGRVAQNILRRIWSRRPKW